MAAEQSRIKPLTTSRARALRGNMTDAELKLWQHVRGRQIMQARFRRQHPVGRYIADFACIEHKLIIELDGGQHQEQKNYDADRSGYIRLQGWVELRFWNHDVLQNIDGVLHVVVEELKRLSTS